MKEKKDLRIIKTRNALYESLLDLMKEKSFEEIKVRDICENALVNRSTFYAHYNDKYELFLDLIENLKNGIRESLDKNEQIANTKEYYIKMIELLLDHMEGKRDVFYAMLLNNRNSIISDIIVDAVNRDLKKNFPEEKNSGVPGEVVSVFFLGAVAGVVLLWIKNSHKYTKQEIIDYLTVLIPDNIEKL